MNRIPPQRLEGFIDLIVEAVLRDLDEISCENGAESGQEQRRREEQAGAIYHTEQQAN